MTNKVTLTVRIPESLYDRLLPIAEKEQRSVNNTIEFLLAKSVEDYENKQKRNDIKY